MQTFTPPHLLQKCQPSLSLPKLPSETSWPSRDPSQRELHQQHFSGTPVLPLPPSAALKEKGRNRAFLCKRALSLLKHAFDRSLRWQRKQNPLQFSIINLLPPLTSPVRVCRTKQDRIVTTLLNLFFTPRFSLRRDCQKLPMPTIFQVVMAGYWEKFSISNNRASD